MAAAFGVNGALDHRPRVRVALGGTREHDERRAPDLDDERGECGDDLAQLFASSRSSSMNACGGSARSASLRPDWSVRTKT